MKWFLLCLVLAAMIGLAGAAGCGPAPRGPAAGPPITIEGTGPRAIVIGGQAVDPATHAIVIPDVTTPQEKFAADDLAAHIEKMTGKRLAVVAEGALAQQTPIVVGRCTKTLKRLGVAIDFDSLGLEGIAIEARGPALVLAGNKRGVLYAVYTFLEDYCGCRWFTPDCAVIPTTGTVRVGDLSVRYVPPLESRSTDYPKSRDADWAVRNKINGTQTQLDEARGGKVSYSHFVHTFNDILDPAKAFAVHPEYFSEVKGKRLAERTQLCLTNPAVLEIAKKTVRNWIQDAPQATIFSVSQNDWGNFCTCAGCKAVADAEGSQAGPLIAFVNAIADDIARDYPDKVIDTLAYQWSRKPPLAIRPRPNVCVRLCSIECCFSHPLDVCETNRTFVEDIRGWHRLCNRMYIWDYVINYAHSVMPFPDLRVLAPNIRFFVANGVKGIYEEACYFTKGSELAELRTYIMAKTLWDPAYDTDMAINEFCDAYYGPASPPIRQYIKLLHDQVAEHKDWHAHIFDKPQMPYLGAEFTAEALHYLDQTEAPAAGNPVIAHRVALVRLPIVYLQIVSAKPGDAKAAEWLALFEKTARAEGMTTVREHGGTGVLDVWLAAQRERLKLAPPAAPATPAKK